MFIRRIQCPIEVTIALRFRMPCRYWLTVVFFESLLNFGLSQICCPLRFKRFALRYKKS